MADVNEKVITLKNLDEYDTGLKKQIEEKFATKEEAETSTKSLPYFGI